MSGLYILPTGGTGIDETKHKLGELCAKGHSWNGLSQSLRRISDSSCLECLRDKSKRHYYRNLEANRTKARARMAAKREDPLQHEAIKQRNRENNRKRRQAQGRESQAKDLKGLIVPMGRGLTKLETDAIRTLVAEGHPLEWLHLEPLIEPAVQMAELNQAIQAAGQCPSVARLVMDEQRRYWKENPDARKEHLRRWAQLRWWLEYQTKPELRLYTRQKSKRRKAMERQQTAHHLPAKQIRLRFTEFDNCCAYCGAAGDMQIEHVVAISQGGTHAMGNIVPACRRCNYSKRDNEVQKWYQAQPFYSELRWRKIRRVLNWDRGAIGQLALL